jgi:hypothetical protein
VKERLKKQWKEQRQGTPISVGSKLDRGNRLTRFEELNKHLHLGNLASSEGSPSLFLKPILVEGCRIG